MQYRDANVGACTNSCRWGYNVRSLYAEIEESSKRQGEWMPIEEDEHGSYLLNSKDLCALPLIKRLMDIGVDSLKIEGRSRSPFYSGAVSRAYRLAIDSIAAGGEIPNESFEIVNSIPSRGYTTGLLEVHRPDETQEYTTNSPTHGNWIIVGAIEEQKDERLYIKVKNRFAKDDKLILFTPKGQILLNGNTMLDKHGKPCDLAPGDGYYVSLALKDPVDISTAVLLRANH